jgi:hypothetical protein
VSKVFEDQDYFRTDAAARKRSKGALIAEALPCPTVQAR